MTKRPVPHRHAAALSYLLAVGCLAALVVLTLWAHFSDDPVRRAIAYMAACLLALAGLILGMMGSNIQKRRRYHAARRE